MNTHTQTGSMGVETIVLDMLRPIASQGEVIPGNSIRVDIDGGPVTVSTKVAGQTAFVVQSVVEDDAVIFDQPDIIELEMVATGSLNFSVTDFD